ncbi:MAG: S-layer homology domain-containing protein, partial [Veillonella sp.]|nr:S-layer homology domain-containing protein [Veillonella sp.]
LNNRIDNLGDRMNKAVAGTAALAALHPLDFNPDDKWSFAAGYGNYRGANAAAVGAYYQPNEDLLFSVGSSMGNGENVLNAGVSFKLGRGQHVNTTRVAMAKEIIDLRKENKNLKDRLDRLEERMNNPFGSLDMSKKVDFPDVPANHWAYQYVATLAGNGIIEGYPDNTYKGQQNITRYEMAALFYRALQNGAPIDDNMNKGLIEFSPELQDIAASRVRVDRVSGKDNDRHKVERAHVNNEDRKIKDIYGSNIKTK